MIYKFKDKAPDIGKAAFVANSADIVGEVTLGEDSAVWFNAVLRGDIAPVVVGKNTNIQECSVLHVETDKPCIVGDNVTIGHGAIVHAAKIGNECLIGMGAIVLSKAEIGEGSVVGAGALVTEGKIFPPRSLIVGSPARRIRELTDSDIEKIKKSAEKYVGLGKEMAKRRGISAEEALDPITF
ncbi:MAG: gamma carbonic anhydrase family protein [Spirochaetes bacterium]|nr:gamma carbonic anhydrase family protein [Spirochaetota bacterium]